MKHPYLYQRCGICEKIMVGIMKHLSGINQFDKKVAREVCYECLTKKHSSDEVVELDK